MRWLQRILQRLAEHPDEVVVQEVHDGTLRGVTGRELADCVARARAGLRGLGLAPGDRVVILGPNSVRWLALDLAAMAEGLTAVALYVRQAPEELSYAMRDCAAAAIFVEDEALAAALPNDLPLRGFDGLEATPARIDAPCCAVPDDRPVALIYTSGTSGRSKGVALGDTNIEHMLGCTTERLDELLADVAGTQRVFHYLPMCFAGSWIMMLTCLISPRRQLILSTDLNQLRTEIAAARPHVFLNVPQLLERFRSGIEDQVNARRLTRGLLARARAVWDRRRAGTPAALDGPWWLVARSVLLDPVRRRVGADLRALICGSAPLAPDTQEFFHMVGLPVLQVYGLTETTAICTMDRPGHNIPGRVGSPIRGIDMKLGDHDEVLIRGPHVFLGYWDPDRQQVAAHTAEWFRTGDQGDVDDTGTWRIIGRLKNLIILSSGHNIVPDPLEDLVRRALPTADQVLVIGNQRSHLAAIITGDVDDPTIDHALAQVNARLPHYKQIHKWLVHAEPFSVANGLLTANGKLRRDAIAEALAGDIAALYAGHTRQVTAS